ncbi:MAG TPA: tetratricopeptide repeat protein, partial [Christiangramia sp.]|nr:tetratricopeptide repeat protein [Christiangramia sp.]
MPRLFFTFLLVCIFSGFSYSQSGKLNEKNLNNQSLDSSLTWMRANQTSEENLEKFLEVGLNTLERSLDTENDTLIAQIHESLASWHAYNGLYSSDSVVYHAEKALSYYLKGEDQKKIADTYRSLSIDYLNTGQFDKAQEVLFKSIELYEEINDEAGLGSAYRTLGVKFRVMEDYEKSIEYTNQAIPLLEKTKNYGALAIAQFNLIIGYGELGEYEKAYEATEYCLEIIRTKAPEEIFVPVRAYSYRGDVYIKAQDYENALEDYISAWELCKEHVGEERCTTYRTEIGKIYLLKKNYEQALVHLLAGVKAYEDKEQNGLIQPYLDLSEAYMQLGDFENALVYREKAYNNSKALLEGKIENIESEMA